MKKFSVKTLVALTVLVTALRGFVTISAGTMSLSAVGSLVLTVSLWREYLLTSAKLRTVRTVLAMEEPLAAARVSC